MKKTNEKAWYPLVEKWLKRYFDCFKTDTDTDLKLSRIDIIGIKDTSGDLSEEIEIISVQIKRSSELFANASGQALGYKVYANRVYLADVRDNKFTSEEISIANHLGIGLIQIKEGKCIEIRTSPYYKSLPSASRQLLEKLDLYRCQLCGCFFDIACDDNRFSNSSISKIKTNTGKEKSLMFWNWSVGKRKKNTGATQSGSYDTNEKRYLCPDCVKYFNDWAVSIFTKENRLSKSL